MNKHMGMAREVLFMIPMTHINNYNNNIIVHEYTGPQHPHYHLTGSYRSSSGY